VHRVTADSNIYISALLFGGKPLTLLEMAQEGQIELAVSDDLLAETLGVLRDKFKRTPEQLKQDEASIVAVTRHVVPAERLDTVPSDPDDNRALECAVAAGSETIVTGDGDLLSLGSFRGMKISKVSEFLAGLEARGR
jgi:putative PIN family toxin of toxin-antitoxin system